MEDNKTRIAVTSFNSSGYQKYGERMIKTFRQFWPDDIPLVVVSEDPLPLVSTDQIFFHDYSVIAPEGVHFKNKFGSFDKANGKIIKFKETSDGMIVTNEYDYRFDAIRFSHKVFSLFGATRNYDVDEMIWLDGDTFTHAPIDDRFFEETSPGDGHLSYLGRDHMYSECGFMIFNRRNKIHDIFFNQLVTEYLNGELFLLSQWHDCMMIDVMREHFAKTEGIEYKNLSGKASSSMHPFVETVLGEYMDHLKGPERKETGSSHQH
jgi:hypothetical protein